MPALVEKANQKYPNMNLKGTTPSHDFTLLIKEDIANKVQSSTFIINMKREGHPFCRH
ncbi:YopJ family acetyltransferase [Bartonella birtlesii]